jgi:hypothetical protein
VRVYLEASRPKKLSPVWTQHTRPREAFLGMTGRTQFDRSCRCGWNVQHHGLWRRKSSRGRKKSRRRPGDLSGVYEADTPGTRRLRDPSRRIWRGLRMRVARVTEVFEKGSRGKCQPGTPLVRVTRRLRDDPPSSFRQPRPSQALRERREILLSLKG